MRGRGWFVGIVLGAGVLLASPAAWAATYNVTDNSSDMTTPGSLPWCVQQANSSPGQPDIINFTISNSITVHTVLTIIDQVDIRGNSNSVGSHDGTGASPQNCFAFAPGSDGSTITGLAIVDSTTGIALLSNHNRVANCRVGLDWAGSARGNVWGIYDQGQNNHIGGGPGQGNIVVDNATAGIYLVNSYRSRIQGNTVGTNPAGTAALGTQTVGIYLDGAVQTLIGGDRTAGLGNLVSGNTAYGLLLENATTLGNTLCGNVIGLSAGETAAIPNQADGIRLQEAQGNIIGLPLAGYENVVAGNRQNNIILYEGSSTPTRVQHTTLQNNYIGVNSASADGFDGSVYSLYLNGADYNLIGGDRSTLERNVISGNTTTAGVYVNGRNNTICGNYIGTNASGSSARPNGTGISLGGAANGNIIGGTNQGGSLRGNVVSGNLSFGIIVQGGLDNAIYGNYVGLDGDGGVALGNGNRGIYLGGGSGRCRVGDLSPERRNVLADNAFGAMSILYTSLNRIEGNYVGMNAAGTAFIPNGGSFSLEVTGAQRNWVAGNAFSRTVSLNGNNCTGNTLVANRIGILPSGASTGENVGVSLSNSAVGNFIGLPGGQGNLISEMSQYGIVLNNATVRNNGLYGNTITACATQPIVLQSGANNSQPAPTIALAVASTLISGTAGASDYIEVFVAEGSAGNGGSVRYVGATTADGAGNWSLNPGGAVSAGEYVCALATDPANNTSEFSSNVLVLPPPTPAVTATPTVTPTPTVSPTPTVTATNALAGVDLGGKQVLAYPNPAQDQMTFVFGLDQAAGVKVVIYNLAGERVAELAGDFAAGRGQTLVWGCGDAAPGVYLARFMVNGAEKAKLKVGVIQ